MTASREGLACAWELEGVLGLPFVIRDNGDLAVEPDALTRWWESHRTSAMAAYDERHPAAVEDRDDWPKRASYMHALTELKNEVSREIDRAQLGEPASPTLLVSWSRVAPLFADRCTATKWGLT